MTLDSKSQIKNGAIISYAALGINIVAALLYTPWMILEVGQANYGLYTLAISFISLFLVDFGISAALSRFLSKYRAEGNEYEARRVLGATYTVYFVIDCIIFISLLLIYLNIKVIYRELSDDEMEIFKIIFLMVGTFNLISFPAITQSGILTSYEKFIELKLCDLCRKLLAIAFVVLALLNKMGIVWVVAANISAELLAIVAKYIIIRTKVGLTPIYRGLNFNLYKSIFNFSIWMTVISFAQKFVYNIAPSILGIVSGAIAISIYGPASSLGSYFFAIAAAANGLFLPYVSRKVANQQHQDIQRLMIQMGQFQILLLGMVFACFTVTGQMFINLWLGPNFNLTYFCTVLLFLPAIFEYSQQIGTTLIIAKNAVKYQAIGFLCISLVTLGLSFILAMQWGAIGVCMSICITGFANVKLQSWIFSRKLGLDMKEFNRKVVLPSLLPMILAIIVGYYITSQFAFTWFNFSICAMLTIVIYAAFNLLMNPSSRLLLTLIKNKS